jgi:hypothetical protein
LWGVGAKRRCGGVVEPLFAATTSAGSNEAAFKVVVDALNGSRDALVRDRADLL